MTDWKREFEVAVATQALQEDRKRSLLPVQEGDEIEVTVDYDRGYGYCEDSWEPAHSSLEIRLYRRGQEVFYTSYSDGDFEEFWKRLMK